MVCDSAEKLFLMKKQQNIRYRNVTERYNTDYSLKTFDLAQETLKTGGGLRNGELYDADC